MREGGATAYRNEGRNDNAKRNKRSFTAAIRYRISVLFLTVW
jgi:hypothetical protein